MPVPKFQIQLVDVKILHSIGEDFKPLVVLDEK